MASMTTLSKFQHTRAIAVRNPWSSRVLVGVPRRPFQGSCRHEATATATAEDVSQKTKEVAGKVSETAQDIAEKAKQTAQDAWGSVKDTTQKIKETVAGKAEESKESIKQNAETVKRSMNTKN